MNTVKNIIRGNGSDNNLVGNNTIQIDAQYRISPADDAIYGYGGNDTLEGRGGDDELYGHGDDDELFGGKGNDELFGGSGDDYLVGYQNYNAVEIDKLTGGSGDDRFIVGGFHNNGYDNAGNDDYAHITDFENGDVVELDDENGLNYELAASPIGSISGTGVYANSDLVAVIEGVNPSNLSIDTVFGLNIIEYQNNEFVLADFG